MEVHFYVWFYTDLYIKYRFNCKLKTKRSFFEKCFFHYCRWDNGKMNIPHRILTPDDPDTGIPGKYTEVNTSNECVTTPQSSYGDVSTWQPLRQAFLESLYRILIGCSTWDQQSIHVCTSCQEISCNMIQCTDNHVPSFIAILSKLLE